LIELQNSKGKPQSEEKKIGNPKEIIIAELEKEQLAYTKVRSEPIIDRGISVQGEDNKKTVAATELKDHAEYKGGVEKIKPYANKKQRALTLAAFMRCIYNVYTYSDSKGRAQVLSKLREKRNLKLLTQLVFTTDWLDANIGSKYLRLCQLILQTNPKANYADKEVLELNEIACAAAKEMLAFMFNRFKNEDKVPFTMRENLLLAELAGFGGCICKQAEYLPYSSMDLNEEEKNGVSKKKMQVLTPGETPGENPNEIDNTYFVVPPRFDTHGPDYLPSPQRMCAEYTLSQLLPYKSMYTFTLMIFYFTRKLDEIRNNKEIKNKASEFERIEDARAATISGLGSYISICKNEKYQFLEEIMKQCIYEKKYLRKSYTQEILTVMHQRLIITAIEGFIFENYLNRTGEKERVLDTYHCEFTLYFY